MRVETSAGNRPALSPKRELVLAPLQLPIPDRGKRMCLAVGKMDELCDHLPGRLPDAASISAAARRHPCPRPTACDPCECGAQRGYRPAHTAPHPANGDLTAAETEAEARPALRGLAARFARKKRSIAQRQIAEFAR